MTELNYKVIQNIRDFQKLEHRWNSLLEACPGHTIFQTWEWQSAWLEIFEKNPYVILIYEGNELIAILPFFKEDYLFFIILRLIGTPDSDYLDLITKKGSERKAFFFFFMEIINKNRSIGIVDLHSVNETSPVCSLMHEISFSPIIPPLKGDVRSDTYNIVISEKICPYIPISGTWDEYLMSLSSSTRYLIRRKERKMHKDFRVSTGFVRTAANYEKRMDDFFLQHQKRWKSRNKPGAFAKNEFREFQFKVGKRLFDKGMVRLYFLELNNHPAASYYLFHYRNSLYFYLSGFDPAYAGYSPGVVLMGKAIKDAFREGMDEFDLMRGSEAYKFKWSYKTRINCNFIIERKIVSVKFYVLIKSILDKFSQLVKRDVAAHIKAVFRKLYRELFLRKGMKT